MGEREDGWTVGAAVKDRKEEREKLKKSWWNKKQRTGRWKCVWVRQAKTINALLRYKNVRDEE